MRKRAIWVVEMFFEDRPQDGWQPASGYVGQTREDARAERKRADRNAGIRCRVRRYTPERTED